jgi:LysR family glycine cleavage system transcriptional activator
VRSKLWPAADELNLTRSAVSHQLRLLEKDLGFKILGRTGNRVDISPRAMAYAQDVRLALGLIANAPVLRDEDVLSGALTISCPPGFAADWLCLNIGDFLEQHPKVIPTIISARNLSDTINPDIDSFITFGLEPRPNLFAEPLVGVAFTPLCSPAYHARFGSFTDLTALSDATLLHIGDFTDWENWMRQAGLPVRMAQSGVCYSDINVVYTALLAGEGIGIGDTVIWHQALERGQLIQPFRTTLHTETGYYLCAPEANLSNPLVIAFHDWLKSRLETMRKDDAE